MREQDIRTAQHFGLLEQYTALEAGLQGISMVTEVNISLVGLYNPVRQVVIQVKYFIPTVTKHNVPLPPEQFYESKRKLIDSVLYVADFYGLCVAENGIEDFEGYFYFTFEWKEQ